MSQGSTGLSRAERVTPARQTAKPADTELAPPLSRFLRIEQVMEFTGLPRSTVYEMVARGLLPGPVPVTPRRRMWLESELLTWRDAKLAERDEAKNAA